MTPLASRREFLRKLQLGAASLPFVTNLSAFAATPATTKRKQRLVIMFSPNGVVQPNFWPDEEGAKFKLKPILEPLAAYQDKLLMLHGVCDKIRGDGDSHMRGIGCLLTGIELFPGNIQGGGNTPAGWSSGHSIDQEIKNFLQADPATRTRFGSLEFGVGVPDRADTWTRMVYAGPNKPTAPNACPSSPLSSAAVSPRPRITFKRIPGSARSSARAALTSLSISSTDIGIATSSRSSRLPSSPKALAKEWTASWETSLYVEMRRFTARKPRGVS